jgi:hypothetical protein
LRLKLSLIASVLCGPLPYGAQFPTTVFVPEDRAAADHSGGGPLGVSKEQLVKAVEKVGNTAATERKELARLDQ